MKLFVLLIFSLARSMQALGANYTEEDLVAIANQINESMPRRMDQFTIANNVNALPGLVLVYKYTIELDPLLEQLSRQQNSTPDRIRSSLESKFGSIQEFLRAAVSNVGITAKNTYCSSPESEELDPRFLARKGVTIEHKFYDKSGTYIGFYAFDSETCDE